MNTPQRARRRHHLIQAIALVGLIALTAAAAIPLQRLLSRRMDQIKRNVVEYLETATGREITFESFSPSILRYVEIRDMRILSPDRDDLLKVTRVRVYFNLISILRGDIEKSLRRISIEDTVFAIDLERDTDLVAFAEELFKRDSADRSTTLPSGIVIGGKNLTVAVRSGGTTVEANEVFFDLDSADDIYNLRLTAKTRGSFDSTGFVESASAGIELTAQLGHLLDNMNGTLAVSDLNTSHFSVIDQTLQVRLREGKWTFRKIQDRLPIDLEVAFVPAESRLDLRISSDRFVPESFVEPRGAFDSAARWLGLTLSGSASLNVSLADRTIGYSADLRATLPYDFLPEPLSVSARFSGDEGGVTVEELEVTASKGRVVYSGTVAFGSIQPTGTLTFDDVTYLTGRPLSGSGHFAYRDGSIFFDSDSFTIGRETITDLSAVLRQFDGGVDFTAGLSIGEGSALTVEGGVTLGETRSLDIEAHLSSVGAESILRLATGEPTPPALKGKIEDLMINGDVFLQSPDFERFSFSVPSLRASSAENDVSFQIVASGNNDEIRLNEIIGTWRGEILSGSAAVGLEGAGLAGIRGELKFHDTTYGFQGQFDSETGLFLTGDFGLTAAVLNQDDERLFRLSCADFPITIGNEEFTINLDTSGSFRSTDDWNLNIGEASISPLPSLPAGEGSARISGTLTPSEAHLTQIEIADGFSRISGAAEFHYGREKGFAISGTATLADSISFESYSASFQYGDELLRIDLGFSEAPIGRYATLPLLGLASGTLAVSGSSKSPDIHAHIIVEEGRFNDNMVDLEATIAFDDEHLGVTDASVGLKTSRLEDVELQVDFADSSFTAGALFTGLLQGKPLRAELGLAGVLDGEIGKRSLASIIDAEFRSFATIDNVFVDGEAAREWTFDVIRRESLITIDGGLDDAVTGEIALDGTFAVQLGAPLPVSMKATGKISSGDIEASLSGVRIDLQGVEKVVTIPYFNVESGSAVSGASLVRITGRLNDPDIYGDLRAFDLVGRVPVVPETIGPFDARLSFQGKKLVIDEALIPVGNGLARAYADFTLDHWIPKTYEIELVTAPENRNGLHVRYNFGGIDIDGYGEGVLHVSGDPLATRLDGDLTIRNTDVQMGEKPPRGSGGGPGTIVDLRFTTGRQVTFFWPSENLPVLRSSADTGQLLHLRSNSLDGSLSIDGDIRIRGGDIFYFKRSFYIREGDIAFNETEDRFDPFITLRAEAKDRTLEGEDLTIYLVVDNQAFSQFNPRFESDPPMSSVEILTRLGQSIVHNEYGDPSLSSALLLTTDIISQFGIFRNVEQSVRDILQLDLFSLRTQIIQNILTENVFPEAGATLGTQPTVGKYLDNTTLFLGKYFGNDLFIEAMFRLRSNQALLTSATSSQDLYIDSEIRLEWRTPLFLLEFSMLPDLVDPMASITRSSIGLSWNLLY